MPKLVQPVNPPTLAKPLGYSHAVEVQGGKTLYVSGQVALDRDGKLVGQGDMAAQFRQICLNLKAVLVARAGQLGQGPLRRRQGLPHGDRGGRDHGLRSPPCPSRATS